MVGKGAQTSGIEFYAKLVTLKAEKEYLQIGPTKTAPLLISTIEIRVL